MPWDDSIQIREVIDRVRIWLGSKEPESVVFEEDEEEYELLDVDVNDTEEKIEELEETVEVPEETPDEPSEVNEAEDRDD